MSGQSADYICYALIDTDVSSSKEVSRVSPAAFPLVNELTWQQGDRISSGSTQGMSAHIPPV